VTYTIIPADDDVTLGAFCDVVRIVTPESAWTPQEASYNAAVKGAGERLLVVEGGVGIAAAHAGRIFHYPATFDAWWCEIAVIDRYRRRGIGCDLLRRVSAAAAAAGKSALHAPTSERDPDGVAFATRRGFVEYERYQPLRLRVADAASPAVAPPAGVSIVTLRDRPDLERAVHAVFVATARDVPHGGEATDPGSFDEWRAFTLEHPSARADALFVAVAGDVVIGFAQLVFPGAQPGSALHEMTAVTRPWRGRGVASALKRAQLCYAATVGLGWLETENHVDNAPMRAINQRLGYQPAAQRITMRGPLARPTGG
jgi:mycothiol synthase